MEGNQLLENYKRDGYIICRNFFSEEEVKRLLEDIQSAKLRYGHDVLTNGGLMFNSSIFFNSEKLQSFISQQKIIDLLSQLIGPNIWVRWDQAVAKQPGAKTFPWHQDNSYSRVKDPHYQLWIALTEMTPENGGLWLQPGSHKGPLPHKRVGHEQVYDGTPENPVFIGAKPGDVVVFSSFTLHSTTPNVTDHPRWAYVIEYMSADHYDPYLEPPYFMVSKDGKSNPEFVDSYPGKANPLNHLKYLGDNWNPRQLVPGPMKKAIKALANRT
jgi:ectoine hydroxylase-related dioxygenase (phytanoyl-CoA dioxygenase family)